MKKTDTTDCSTNGGATQTAADSSISEQSDISEVDSDETTAKSSKKNTPADRSEQKG